MIHKLPIHLYVTPGDIEAFTNTTLEAEAMFLEEEASSTVQTPPQRRDILPKDLTISDDWVPPMHQDGSRLNEGYNNYHNVSVHHPNPMFLLDDPAARRRAQEIFDTVSDIPLSLTKPVTESLPGIIDYDDPRSYANYRVPDSVISDYPFTSYVGHKLLPTPVMTFFIGKIMEQIPITHVLAAGSLLART